MGTKPTVRIALFNLSVPATRSFWKPRIMMYRTTVLAGAVSSQVLTSLTIANTDNKITFFDAFLWVVNYYDHVGATVATA